MNKKKVIILVLIVVLLIGIIGISFAMFSYVGSGTVNSKQIVGDIYMHYNESNTLTLSNAMPRSSYISNQYFEFTVDGKNTTTDKDIYYDILLSHGEVPNNKTEENRISDQFLNFRLVEVINNEETEIFNNKSYISLVDKRIYVNKIPKNSNSQINHTYRLYMWIGDDVTIGLGDVDYSMSVWEELFATVKITVTGDFTEKEAGNPVRRVVYNQMNNGGSNYIKSYSETKGDENFDTSDTVGTNSNKLDVLYYTGSEALEHSNVLYAGYCWQIIRTTDTGGLRIIYNGPAENNMCLTTRNSSGNLKGINGAQGAAVPLSSTTIYGTGYDYDLEAGTFTLTGVMTNKNWSTDYEDLIGTYTCKDNVTTCNRIYYIGLYNSATTGYAASYTIGTVSSNKQIGTSAYNAYYTSPVFVGYMYNKTYTNKTGTKSGNYANSVTWDSTNNVYVLDSTTTTNLTAPNESHHYVCDDTCAKVRFYYYLSGSTYYYILLENGDTNPVYAMFNGKTQNETLDANINRYSSAIKGYVDTWYKKNIDSLKSPVKGLIDTSSVYCNDRSSSNNYGSWNKDSANLGTYLNFYQYTNNKDLKCVNTTDKFSVENEKAQLIYPVGLITESERNLMGNAYATTGQNYWGISPFAFYYRNAMVRYTITTGDTGSNAVDTSGGIRPVITIKSDADIEEGDGSYETPYVIGAKITR